MLHAPRGFKHSFRIFRLPLLLAAVSLASLPAFAGEEGEAETPVVRPDENTIYIPYKDLEKVFEKSGRGVFLPYEKFLELWRKSRPPVLEGREKPPLPAAITASSFDGTVKENIASFKATFQVEVFKKGWTEVPFPFGNLGLSRVAPREKGVVLAPGKKGILNLVVKGPGEYHLEVAFAVKVEEKEGERFFRFQTPAATEARFSVVLPGRNLKVDLKPNLAASETPEPPDATKVFAFLGPSREVEVRWRAKAERIGKLEPILQPTVHSRVRIEEGMMDVEARVSYKILQAPADRFRILFPRDFLLISHDKTNLLRAEKKDSPRGTVLEIRLHSGAKDSYVFNLRLQKALEEFADAEEIPIPVVSTLDTQREDGALAVDLASPLNGKVLKRSGLVQVDVADLPKDLRSRGMDFGFTYQKQPIALTLEVERERPEVECELRGLVFVTEGRIEWKGTLTVEIKRTGIFGLRWLAPAGPKDAPYEIQKLQMRRPGDLNPTTKDAGNGLQWIEVTFPAKKTGKVAIHFELRRERKGELVGSFDLPWFRFPTVKKDRGWVGVKAKEGYDLRLLGKARGFEARNAAEVHPEARLGFVYNLAALEDPSKPEFRARIEVTKRPSRVSAVIFTLVDVTDAAVNVEHRILYSIEQAGVRTFTYSLPGWIKPKEKEEEGGEGKKGWEIFDPEIPEKKQDSETYEEERDRIVWTVEIQKERMKTVELKVRYKMALENLKPGEPVQLEVPDLQVEEVFQATGYIGLKKGDNIVLTPMAGKVGKLTKADLSEWKSAVQGKNPFTVFRYTEYPWSLNLGITKYDYEKVLPTIVHHVHVDSVVTEEREVRTRVLLALQNKERQSLRLRFPEGARITFLSVDGKHVNPSRSGEGDPRVKLVNLNAVRGREDEFIINIHYDITPERKGMEALEVFPISVPEVLGEEGERAFPPVARLTLDLYLPPDYEYLSLGSDSMTRLTRTRGIWERIRDFFLGTGGQEDQASDIAQSVSVIKAKADAKKAPGEPEFKIIKSKRHFQFYKLSGGGSIAVTYMGPTLFKFLNVLLLVAAVAILVFFPYFEIAGRTHLLVAFTVGALLISALSESLTPFMGTVFLGTMCAAVFWVGFYILREIPPMIRPKEPPRPSRAPRKPKPPGSPSDIPETPVKTDLDEAEEKKGPVKRVRKKEPAQPKKESKPRSSERASARKSSRKPSKKESGRSAKKGRGKA